LSSDRTRHAVEIAEQLADNGAEVSKKKKCWDSVLLGLRVSFSSFQKVFTRIARRVNLKIWRLVFLLSFFNIVVNITSFGKKKLKKTDALILARLLNTKKYEVFV
jgi:hypothetical protein